MALVFYIAQYSTRSAPGVMIGDLERAPGQSAVGVSNVVGSYYYTYAVVSLIAGVALDRLGAKHVIPIGALLLGIGCLTVLAAVRKLTLDPMPRPCRWSSRIVKASQRPFSGTSVMTGFPGVMTSPISATVMPTVPASGATNFVLSSLARIIENIGQSQVKLCFDGQVVSSRSELVKQERKLARLIVADRLRDVLLARKRLDISGPAKHVLRFFMAFADCQKRAEDPAGPRALAEFERFNERSFRGRPVENAPNGS